MDIDVVAALERMAQNGQPPKEGCRLFGVGYEDAFERLQRVYLKRHFQRGDSAEKFVIGPFGSGKTLFLRQLLEVAREEDCATAEVSLNKDLDFTQNLVVYAEVARELRTPGQEIRGVRALLNACLERVAQRASAADSDPTALTQAWISAMDGADLELEPFARVVQRALEAMLRGDEAAVQAGCRWLSGDMRDREVCKAVGETVLTASEEKLYGRRAMLSLFQLVKRAGFAGTVLGYDEAEQGFSVDKKRVARIHSLLQSEINALSQLERGSALVVYALTPDVVDRMDQFMALQQRVADPGPEQGFFDGNTLAPKIDLMKRGDPVEELIRIAERLHSMLFEHVSDAPLEHKEDAHREVRRIAEEIARTDLSSSSRRAVVKAVSTYLTRLYDSEVIETPGSTEAEV
jgi:hypothetical protein